MNPGETVSICWIDGGNVYSAFASQILTTTLQSQQTENPIVAHRHVTGSIIEQNRDILTKLWIKDPTDWMLWIDSDIVLNIDIYKMLCEKADKDNSPVVSGIYLIDPGGTDGYSYKTFSDPKYCIFPKKEFSLFTNKLEPVNAAGLGLTLVHKSVFQKLISVYGDTNLYNTYLENNSFVGEDISFFRKIDALGIPIFAHTSAIAVHLKTVGVGHDISTMSINMFKNNNLTKQ